MKVANLIAIHFIIFFEAVRGLKDRVGGYDYKSTLVNLCAGNISTAGMYCSATAYLYVYSFVVDHFALWKIADNGLFSWVVGMLLVDFLYYWLHSSFHQVNLFWAAHVTHHTSTNFNLSIGLRNNFVESYFGHLFYLPLALFGFSWEQMGVFIFVEYLFSIYVHMGRVGNLGPLEWVFNTPSHHRLHHATNDCYLAKNNGGVFIFWDRLFGTFVAKSEEPSIGSLSQTNHEDLWKLNTFYFHHLYNCLKKAKSWREKWDLLTRVGSFAPLKPTAVRETPISKELKGYGIFQYFDLMLYMGIIYEQIFLWEIWGGIAIVAFSLNVKTMLQGKSSFFRQEHARQILMMGMKFAYLTQVNTMGFARTISSAFFINLSVFSILFLYFYRKKTAVNCDSLW